MYKHILVAVGHKPDLTTLKSAVAIAMEVGARVTALHVGNPAAHFAGPATGAPSATRITIEAHGCTVADRSRRVLDEAQCQGEVQIRRLRSCDASLGQVIADAARELGADLVIVGSNDPGWFRLYLQNTQKDVVRRCPMPVLVITPPCLPKAQHAKASSNCLSPSSQRGGSPVHHESNH
ncbi:universal stress protein [Paraburkholderia phenazinium]|uniref:Nucleotide-binding universal stress protein, UspA family n=1 Tax=Paraburkholderia phenazinium TaxID=60549 RepID=A0A1G7SKF3_9BURK|nr:universal stress protein [Paraburkholderia phenazinium]SDG23556.1 Nucleotide-binding universal stress protein, UspA family [Paraburkholderia phenazinium]